MASVAQPPQGLHEAVKALMKEKGRETADQSEDEHPQDPPLARASKTFDGYHERNESTTSSSQAHRQRSPRQSSQLPRLAANTPSARTGPPRSISYQYPVSGSHPTSRANSDDEQDGRLEIHLPSPTAEEWEDVDYVGEFAPARSPFRGALEYSDPEQREKEREVVEKRNKRRESASYFPDILNPSKWTSESPRENDARPSIFRRDSRHQGEETNSPTPGTPVIGSPPGSPVIESDETRHIRMDSTQTPISSAASPRLGSTGRSKSLPHFKQDGRPNTAPRWNRLRSLIPSIANQARQTVPASAVVPPSVNITDELITGGLSAVMLRLWIERDEKGHRRVPILFHRLRIRVSDSLHPLHGQKAVFRIECEYANGAARWVVYRQLREFISLHTHYTISNAYNRNVETLPDFPRAGTPPYCCNA